MANTLHLSNGKKVTNGPSRLRTLSAKQSRRCPGFGAPLRRSSHAQRSGAGALARDPGGHLALGGGSSSEVQQPAGLFAQTADTGHRNLPPPDFLVGVVPATNGPRPAQVPLPGPRRPGVPTLTQHPEPAGHLNAGLRPQFSLASGVAPHPSSPQPRLLEHRRGVAADPPRSRWRQSRQAPHDTHLAGSPAAQAAGAAEPGTTGARPRGGASRPRRRVEGAGEEPPGGGGPPNMAERHGRPLNGQLLARPFLLSMLTHLAAAAAAPSCSARRRKEEEDDGRGKQQIGDEQGASFRRGHRPFKVGGSQRRRDAPAQSQVVSPSREPRREAARTTCSRGGGRGSARRPVPVTRSRPGGAGASALGCAESSLPERHSERARESSPVLEASLSGSAAAVPSSDNKPQAKVF